MVGALALVLFAAKWASNPANWYWIAPPQPAAGEPRDAAETPDFTVRDGAPLPPGTVRVATIELGSKEEENAPDGRWPAALFASARDRTVGLTRAERAATAALLERLAKHPAKVAPDAEPPPFPGLMRDPDYYRGRPIRVFGEARGIVDLPNDRGVELWIFPPDSGGNPVRVVANRAKDLPRGERLKEGVPVEANAVFFKLQGYAAEKAGGSEGLHVAPLALADVVTRARIVAATPQTPPALPWVVLGVIGAALAAGGLLVWRWKAADQAFERKTLDRLSAAADGEGEPLNIAADDDDPQAFLAGLSGDAAATKPAEPPPAPTPDSAPASS